MKKSFLLVVASVLVLVGVVGYVAHAYSYQETFTHVCITNKVTLTIGSATTGTQYNCVYNQSQQGYVFSVTVTESGSVSPVQ